MNRPTLYLAGKIGKNDWRHALAPGLRGHLWADGPIDAEHFIYTGPFFVSCDHGCSHGPNRHGAASDAYGEICEPNFLRDEVIANNNASLAAADLVFAYITATDCHGTMGEVAVSVHAGKRVVMAFAPDVRSEDFWYWARQCNAVHLNICQCRLPELLAAEIQKTTPLPDHQKTKGM